ncbi:acyl-CoA thioesterase [Chloroflexota bacterium]
MEGYDFSLELAVRDYECDIQGIVNNAVYQNYLEHVRHKYLKQIGIDFKEYAQKGINLVVVRVELDYKSPLSSGDRFVVGLKLRRESRIRFVFYQDIYRLSDNKPVLKGKIIGAALNQSGHPYIPKEIGDILDAG